MKLKRSEVFGLENAFNQLMQARMNPNVAYNVASNGILAHEEAETIRKSYQPVDGFEEFEKLRSEIISKAGGEREANGSLTLPADKAAAISGVLEKLNEEHKDVVDAQAVYQKEFNAMMENEVDVEFKTINRKELTAEIEPGKLVLLIKTGILTDGDK